MWGDVGRCGEMWGDVGRHGLPPPKGEDAAVTRPHDGVVDAGGHLRGGLQPKL